MRMFEIDTPHGQANAHLHVADDPRAALVLGHGAGGGVNAGDLAAATRAALAQGISVALVEQPYRVAGRRSPAPARQLDAAWTTVVDHLRSDALHGLPLVAGGRSLGARVACRTVAETGRRRRSVPRVPIAAAATPRRRPVASRAPRARCGEGPDAGRAG